jgi:hypothetical protein
MKKSELKQLIKEFIQEEKARYWKGIVPISCFLLMVKLKKVLGL